MPMLTCVAVGVWLVGGGGGGGGGCGCTLDGVYVPGIYSHARWELPYATQDFVVVFVSSL